MSLSRFFESLGAPLANGRWSWGALRADGSVVLRQWSDDEFTAPDGRRCIKVGLTGGATPAGFASHPGWRERKRHLQALESGARCYVVRVKREWVTPSTSKIVGFDHTVLACGNIEDQDGILAVPILGTVQAADLRPLTD